MSTTSTTPSKSVNAVTAKLVQTRRRMLMLPTYFPGTFMVAEGTIYSFLDRLSQDYQGGFWDFFELSNGGFYMAPKASATALKTHFTISVPFGNGYEGELTCDAAGIVACIFAYTYLAETTGKDYYLDLYDNLRNFAYGHPEAAQILRAID